MLLLSVAVAEDATLSYSAPYDIEKGQDLTAYQFTPYFVKDRVFVARPDTPLFGADATTDRAFTLGAGLPVEILAVSGAGPRRWRDRVDTMYEVQAGERRGWVHGGDLTPFAFVEDFDGDGERETATVAFTAEFKIEVTLVEPDLKVGSSVSTYLDAAGGAYLSQDGSTVKADIVPMKKAGVTLIHVWTGVPACADFADYWVVYRTEGPRRLGLLSVALEQGGLMDPPSCSTYAVKFSASRKMAVVTRTDGGCGDKKDKPVVSEDRFILVNGTYRAERAGGVVR